MWKKKWQNCAMAQITKQFHSSIEDRLKKKIKITQNVAAMITGHGKTRAYLHRIKLREKALCACQQGDKTTDNLLYDCKLLNNQREILKKNVTRDGQWPTDKHDLISKHNKPLLNYIESIDFDKL
jgi:hypothetical protein